MNCPSICSGTPLHQCRPLLPRLGVLCRTGLRRQKASRNRSLIIGGLSPTLTEVFTAVSEGRLSPLDAAQTVEESLLNSPSIPVSCLPEVIHGAGQRPDSISQEMKNLAQKQGSILVTGMEPEDYARIRKLIPGVQYHAGAKILKWRPKNQTSKHRLPGFVGIIQEASSPVSEVEKLQLISEFFGCYTFLTKPLSGLSLSKLMIEMEKLNPATVLVVVYNKEQALPDLVAGITDTPVLSVYTGEEVQSPYLPTGSLSVHRNGSFEAARAVAKILRSAERILEIQRGSSKGPEVIEEQIQGAIEFLDDQESSLQSKAGKEAESLDQALNNVVVNDYRDSEVLSSG